MKFKWIKDIKEELVSHEDALVLVRRYCNSSSAAENVVFTADCQFINGSPWYSRQHLLELADSWCMKDGGGDDDRSIREAMPEGKSQDNQGGDSQD